MPPNYMPDTGFPTDYALLAYVTLSLAALTWLFLRHLRHRRGRRSRTRTLLLGNGLVLATLCATLALAGETWFRFARDATDSYGLTMANTVWFRRHFRVNSWNMRDREFDVRKRPGTRRVALLGDSFTAGYGVADPADRFGDRLAAQLAPRSSEVWNCGGMGWSTGDEADWLAWRQPEARFDHVLLAYCLNDVDDLLPAERRFDRESVRAPTWLNPWQSFLQDFVWFRTRVAAEGRAAGYYEWVDEVYESERLWTLQAARMERIAATCAESGARFDVVVFPLFHVWGDSYPFDAAHERVVSGFRSLGARVLDLRESYAGQGGGDLVVNRFDAHPNERAHAIAADAIHAAFFAAD